MYGLISLYVAYTFKFILVSKNRRCYIFLKSAAMRYNLQCCLLFRPLSVCFGIFEIWIIHWHWLSELMCWWVWCHLRLKDGWCISSSFPLYKNHVKISRIRMIRLCWVPADTHAWLSCERASAVNHDVTPPFKGIKKTYQGFTWTHDKNYLKWQKLSLGGGGKYLTCRPTFIF